MFPGEPLDETRITSVSEKTFLVTTLIGSKVNTVSSEVIESEITISKKFKLSSVSLYYTGKRIFVPFSKKTLQVQFV